MSSSLLLWLTYHCVAGYMLVIQKTTTHHGPQLYHAGDELRHDRDWGLHMLDTTRDMDKSEEQYGAMAKPLVYTTFGNHLLHHMFPTVDHSKVNPFLSQNIVFFKCLPISAWKTVPCIVWNPSWVWRKVRFQDLTPTPVWLPCSTG